MPDNKLNMSEQDLLVVEAIIKIAAIERLLLNSGVLKEAELRAEMKKISEEIVANVSMLNKNSNKEGN